jgi:hypothetical protein
MIQFNCALPLDGPFVMLVFIAVIERRSGHPLDLQKEFKAVIGP